jgi:hypothetical protein
VREAGVIARQAVLVAIGIDWDGRRQVLGVELANRETRSSWRDFLMGLRERGLHGVEFIVADDHAGLKAAICEVLPAGAYQRCYVHFLRNALDYVPRKVDDDCLQELRWLEPALGPAFGRTRGTGATSPKRGPISLPGSANGRPSMRGWSPGSKRTSRRRSPSIGCRANTTSI